MLSKVVAFGACIVASADAFSASPTFNVAARTPAMSLRQSGVAVRRSAPLGMTMQEDVDPNQPPKIQFDTMSGWKPAHQMDGAAATGNVDTPDYFEGDAALNQDSTGFTSGAAATGGSGGNKLGQLLSASGTEVRQAERYKAGGNGPVVFNHPKQAWKIDGSWESGDPTFDLQYSQAEACAETEIYIEPNAMTFEDFQAGFTADSDPGWEVDPSEGTMARRGGEGTEFVVKYKGTALDKDPKTCTFVVQLPNDNFQWTFKLRTSFRS